LAASPNIGYTKKLYWDYIFVFGKLVLLIVNNKDLSPRPFLNETLYKSPIFNVEAFFKNYELFRPDPNFF
jgi:hypothetical protein